MSLLKNEQAAKELVNRIGVMRANKIINAIGDRIERRIKLANLDAIGWQLDNSSIRKTPAEVDLMAMLKLGCMLLDTRYDTDAAHQRILARIAKRKAVHQALSVATGY